MMGERDAASRGVGFEKENIGYIIPLTSHSACDTIQQERRQGGKESREMPISESWFDSSCSMCRIHRWLRQRPWKHGNGLALVRIRRLRYRASSNEASRHLNVARRRSFSRFLGGCCIPCLPIPHSRVSPFWRYDTPVRNIFCFGLDTPPTLI